ncbi:MAG TPA: serine/threonine-protein kinase [Planctomycetota bacterium]|nr:serine/threonine-protein kinase [Planctomycetota bacterium]
MSQVIPDDQVQFAQLAVKQRYIQPEQVRAALDLYRRYKAAGGEVPSIARILIGKGWMDRQRGEMLYRHLLKGEPLPPAAIAYAAPAAAAVNAAPIPARKGTPPGNVRPNLDGEFEILDDLGLEPPGSAIDLPVQSNAAAPVVDEREAWIKGMGATVVRKDLVKGYKITQVMGEGSMGIVYRAHQISMDRTVALKVLPEDKTKDQRFVEEFLAEARNAGRLNHPNLIRVHEVGKSGDTYYYSMEYVEGQRLDEWMDECEGGRLDPKQAVNVFIQVAQALDYGFRAGVIHREIRPNTIMVNEDGQAKLADLGLTNDEQTRFLDGENAYYVSPEQVQGGNVDTRTDIYCLGCCLFHCLTGELPFEGGAPKEVLNRRLNEPTPDPREYNPAISPELSRIVMRMMARTPAERFQAPAEVADALKRVTFAAPPAQKKPLPARSPLKRPLRPGGRTPSGRHPQASSRFKRRPGR